MKTLIQSIFYREWHKTRLIVIGSFVITISIMLYILLSFAHDVRASGLTTIVRDIAVNNLQPLAIFKLVPTILGALLAIGQFIPEVTDDKLKLTLHLPFNEHYILATLLGYGTLALSAVLSVGMLLSMIIGKYVPFTMLNYIIISVHPWLASGLITYALVAASIIEPYWARRISLLPIMLTFQFILLLDSQPMALSESWLFMIFSIVVSYIAPFYNMIRYKNGYIK